MPRPLREQVVVITGGSSGIGRATAIALGRRGAAVVLAARGEQGLGAAADDVQAAGGRALTVVCDVSDFAQVQHLAARAAETFGRIDTWVNNAGVIEYATAEDTTNEEFQRILQVNVMGVVHGVKAALPYLARHGDGGIINVASVASVRALPYASAYSASKHAVKGFTEALRLELGRDHPGIGVTLILPGSINTPIFNNARGKLGVQPRPLPPVYDPSIVADAILFAAEHPRKEIFVGGTPKMMAELERLSPAFMDWYMGMGDRAFKQQETDRPDDGRDNLFAPTPGPGSVRGPWGDEAYQSSPYTKYVEPHPTLKRGLMAAAVVGGIALLAGAGRASKG